MPRLTGLDLRDALSSPSILEGPVERAALVATIEAGYPGSDKDELGLGRPYLLSASGEWRRVNPGDYGIEGAAVVELPTALSSDGRTLALADRDPGRIVVIDLATNQQRSFGLPIQVPSALKWSLDQKSLSFVDRLAFNPGRGRYVLDLNSGRSSTSDHHYAYFDFLQGSEVVEIGHGPERAGTLRLTDDGTSFDVALEYPDLLGNSPLVDRLAVWEHRSPTLARLVAVDPFDGTLMGVLTRRDASRYWADLEQWVGPTSVTFSNYPSGDLFQWDVIDRRVRRVGTFATSHTIVEYSDEVLRQLLTPEATG